MLRDLRGCPNIVELHSVYTEDGDKVHMVFSYAPKGTLTDYLNNQSVSEDICRVIM